MKHGEGLLAELKLQISQLDSTNFSTTWESGRPCSLSTHKRTDSTLTHTHNPLTTNQNCSIQSTSPAVLLPLFSVSSLLCVLIVQAFALKLNHLLSISVPFSAQCQKASLLTILWIDEPVVPHIKQCGTVICTVCKVSSLMDSFELLQALELQGFFWHTLVHPH